MAKKSKADPPPPAPPPPVPREVPPLAVRASDNAPFVYFEEAPSFGHYNGVIRVTLEAARLHSEHPGTVTTERVVVAHLRMNVAAARSLKAALEGGLLLANPTASETKN